MRIVLLGAPGSGKGTQGEMLAAHYDVPRLSTGDVLRDAVREGKTLGRRARAAMDAGQLVDDALVVGIIEARLADPDAADGFVLDGFPRNVAQARALERLLAYRKRPPIDLAVHLDVPIRDAVQRLIARGLETGRADDNEATIRKRLIVYMKETHPLFDYYQAEDKLITLNGAGTVTGIFGAMVQAIESHRANEAVG